MNEDKREEFITKLHADSFSIIPLTTENTPAINNWEVYKSEIVDIETLQIWLKTYTNFAIITGKISNCLALEFSGADAAGVLNHTLGLVQHINISNIPHNKYSIFFEFPNSKSKLPINLRVFDTALCQIKNHVDYVPICGDDVICYLKKRNDLYKFTDIKLFVREQIFIEPKKIPLFERCSDTGNAKVFVEKNKNKLKCAIDGKSQHWFFWNDKFWEEDRRNNIYPVAESEIGNWKFDIKRLKNDAEKSKFTAHISKSLNKTSIENMIKLAGNSTELSCTKDEFDRNDYLLNCKNGTLNFKTKEVLLHNPDDLITRCIDINYNPDALCPLWDKFLNEIFQDDVDLINFTQKALGYALAGNNPEDTVFFLYGSGENGKSTLINTISEILGNYATSQPINALSLNKFGNSIGDDFINLEGKRFAVASETQQGMQLDEQKIKTLTNETISGRRLYENLRIVRLTAKIYIDCNHLPTIKNMDHGIWRRIITIPFKANFAGADRILNMKDKLLKEAEGILKWMVDGYCKYEDEGLELPEAVKALKADFKSDMDTIQDFIDEKCEIGDKYFITISDFYKAYAEWEYDRGNSNFKKALSTVSKDLADKGFEKKHRNNGNGFLGLKIYNSFEKYSTRFDDCEDAA